MGERAVEAQVFGRVQGVGFRYSAVQQAQVFGVHGWVRNNGNGSVTCWVEGDAAAVAKMVDWLGHGPRYAEVDRVSVTEHAPAGFAGFSASG